MSEGCQLKAHLSSVTIQRNASKNGARVSHNGGSRLLRAHPPDLPYWQDMEEGLPHGVKPTGRVVVEQMLLLVSWKVRTSTLSWTQNQHNSSRTGVISEFTGSHQHPC